MRKLLLVCILILQACSSDDDFSLKEPTGLSISMDLNRELTKSDRLYFDGGKILISRLQMEGDRVQADDYFFQNGYQPPLQLALDSTIFNPELQFDLPQGIYNRIAMEFEIPSANIPVLEVRGSFQDSTNNWIPLLLEVDSFELFRLLADNIEGDREIVIDNQLGYNALVKLNPVHWFSGISIEQLEEADQSLLSGQMGILINRQSNSGIFTEVSSRLDELNSLTIR